MRRACIIRESNLLSLSNGCMHGHDQVEAILDALQEKSSIVNINVEFAFEGVVHEHAGLDINVVVFRVPVGLEGNGHAVPSLRVRVSQAVTDTLNDALSQHSGLYDSNQ